MRLTALFALGLLACSGPSGVGLVDGDGPTVGAVADAAIGDADGASSTTGPTADASSEVRPERDGGVDSAPAVLADAGTDAKTVVDAAASDAAPDGDAGLVVDAGEPPCTSGATRCVGYEAQLCGFSGWKKIHSSQPGSQACCVTHNRFTLTAHAATDSTTGLEWDRAGAQAAGEGPAEAVCRDIGGVYDSGTGWRLPTVAELQSLMIGVRTASDTICAPTIDQTAFPLTSTQFPYATDVAVTVVSFSGDATVGTVTPGANRSVRCVR